MTPTPPVRALRASVLVAALFISAGCRDEVAPFVPDDELVRRMTITAQPSGPTIPPVIGWSALGLETPRDGRIYVPPSYDPATPARLVVLLHGAGTPGVPGSTHLFQSPSFVSWADAHGIVLLATE